MTWDSRRGISARRSRRCRPPPISPRRTTSAGSSGSSAVCSAPGRLHRRTWTVRWHGSETICRSGATQCWPRSASRNGRAATPLPPAAAPRFGPGERVRVRRMRPEGHTRCPRYVRGAIGSRSPACTVTICCPMPSRAASPGLRPRRSMRCSSTSAELSGTGGEPRVSGLRRPLGVVSRGARMTAGEGASGMHVLRPVGNLLGFYDGRGPASASRADRTGWTRGRSPSAPAATPSSTPPRPSSTTPTCRRRTAPRSARQLERRGARTRVALSHWHLDHVAGAAAFADCEVIATPRRRAARRAPGAIEAGTSRARRRSPLWSCRRRLREPHRASVGASCARPRPVRDPQPGRQRRRAARAADSCSPVTPSRTPSPTSASPRPEATSASSSGCGVWTRARSSRTTAAATIIEGGGYAPDSDRRDAAVRPQPLRHRARSAEQHADLGAFVSEELAAGMDPWFEPYERVHESNLAAVRGR